MGWARWLHARAHQVGWSPHLPIPPVNQGGTGGRGKRGRPHLTHPLPNSLTHALPLRTRDFKQGLGMATAGDDCMR
jgi:hypothetical protein